MTTDDASFETLEDVEVAFVNLRGQVNGLRNKVSTLEDRVDEALADQSTSAELEELRAEIRLVRNEVDGLAGLAEGQSSTPEKRAADLRQKLAQLARNKDRTTERDTVARDYNGVKDILVTLGHEPVYDWQAYDAMEDAAEADGFAYVEKDDGNDVIRAKLSAITPEGGVIQNNRAGAGGTASETPEQGGASSGD